MAATPYFSYLTDELPLHVRNLVQVLSPRREDNFVAGTGAGGYGAVKWLLRAPAMFSGAACLSGDVDMVSALRAREETDTLTAPWIAAFGSAARIEGTADDNLHLARQAVAAGEVVAPIRLVWSAADEGARRGRVSARAMAESGIAVLHREVPRQDGWALWDAEISDFIGSVVAPSGARR